MVGQLAESLQTTADYAVCCEGQEVKVAFESDPDAKTLGNSVGVNGAVFLLVGTPWHSHGGHFSDKLGCWGCFL